MAKTIYARGMGDYDEGQTDEAVVAGQIIERGGGKEVQKNTTAGRNAGLIVALENTAVGGGLDSAYAANDTVKLIKPQKGDIVNVRVKGGTAAITENSNLQTTNDGFVTGTGATDENACGIALEALDVSACRC